MPSLILIKSPLAGNANQAFPLNSPIVVLGREATCDIVIPNPTNSPNSAVSRKHAQITRQPGGQYFVEDLKSRNGTMVNNEPVEKPRLLKNDDRLKICDFLYRFHDENAPLPLPRDFSSSYFQNSEEKETEGQSTIEHAFTARGADKLLESQPAERIRALFEISTALSRTTALPKLMDAIADSMLNVFRQADRCFVILKEEGDRLVTKVVKSRRAAGAEDDQRFSRTIVRRALETGEAYLSEDASSDSNLGAAMSVAEFRIRSVMCVPLTTPEGAPIGAVQIDTQDRTKKFHTVDLELLAIVANLVGIALDNARLHLTEIERMKQQGEIELAKMVQLGILPQSEPPLAGYEFYHHYSAALTVGGDYYDFIPLSDGRVAVLLGDVAGKGVPASLLMAKLSAEAKFCLLTQNDLAAAIRLLNEQLIRGGIGDRFVTLAAVAIDPAKNRAVIVNAGHINPLIYRAGVFSEAITSADSGLPLGVLSGYPYSSIERPFDPGENMLIFSDGVTDSINAAGKMFEMDGVRRALSGDIEAYNRPTAIGERVIKCVKMHAAGKAQNDDIAFVCVGRLLENLPPRANDTGSLHPQVRGGIA